MKRSANPYRLDRAVLPVLYDIELEPDLEKYTFTGSETVTVRAAKPFSKITLHALELKVLEASYESAVTGACHRAVKISYNAKMETVTLDFGRNFPAGAPAGRLKLRFEGALNDKMHGFYRTSYEVNGQRRWGAATQFEATDARRAFPCWDEPDIKARFRASLKVPGHMTALSNMPVERETREGRPGYKTVVYQTTPVMPTYLVCFVVAELEYVEAVDRHGVWVRIYTSPGKKEQGRFALEVALHTLPYFAQWFGIRYCLPKLDMVALPDFASGAMENWGLVTYRETALLVDPKNSSAASRQRVAEVIDHELAHQWFGNLVTMEWWTDLWLNEGFASYVGPKAVDHQFPGWKIWNQFVATEYLAALHDDSLRSTHAIEIPVRDPHEIREIFDHITYSKGSSVNRMLENYLGEPVFRKGLRAYLKKYEFGNARTGDLWDALEKASGKPVRSMMASFTRREGYPVLSADLKRTGKGRAKLELSQERFFSDGAKDRKRESWKVPVGLIGPGMKKPRYLFMSGAKLSAPVPSSGGWLKLNPGQSGFYRVAYSPEMLSRLAAAIRSKALAAVDCLGIVDDAFVLARAGKVPSAGLLELLDACREERDYNLWLVISGVTNQIESALESIGEEGRMAAFGRYLFSPSAGRLGWNAHHTDHHLDLLLRPLALARLGSFGEPAVIEEARRRFAAFTAGGTLDPNLRGAVYGICAKYGGAAEHEKLMRAYERSTLQEEKIRCLRAMTRFRDKDLIRRVLRFGLSDQVRSQDKYVIFGGFGSNPAGRAIAWEFVKKEWHSFERLYGGGNVKLLAYISEGAIQGFTSPAALDDAIGFFRHHKVRGTERAIRQALESLSVNIRWVQRDRDSMSRWLAGKGYAAGPAAPRTRPVSLSAERA